VTAPRSDADELDRGILKPSNPSTGGSSFTALDRRSSPLAKVKEAIPCSVASDSSSLESLS